ncbi:MAG: hypothetical protein JNG82_07880 [Opitutaceae bacterium]|nr:hypothetical protein [Opitutaceae bacterium]
MRTFRLRLGLLLALGALAILRADSPHPTPPRVAVAPMKTSIYVGSVTLSTTDFLAQDKGFQATYEAKVRPWFFWGETGRITIRLPAAELARLTQGHAIEFTGEATNHRNKPRTVTGRAQPAGANSGKIKVRIMADGIELIFNGSYQLSTATPAGTPALTPPSGT